LQEPASKAQKTQKNTGQKKFLADNLDAFSPFAAAPSAPVPRIFRVASLFESIPVQPITLDTAQAFIEEPDLSHRCPQKAEAAATSTSVVSGFRSLFGFWLERAPCQEWVLFILLHLMQTTLRQHKLAVLIEAVLIFILRGWMAILVFMSCVWKL
jgi:hypothetical protein